MRIQSAGLPGLLLAAVLAAQGMSQQELGTERPKLGIYISGIIVSDVDAGSPAAIAGIRAGDVLLKWEVILLPDVAKAHELLSTAEAGSRVSLSVLRGDEALTLQVHFSPKSEPRLGITPIYGIRVHNVVPKSVAARSGLLRGDVIVAFDGDDVETHAGFMESLRSVKAGARVPVKLLRQGKPAALDLVFDSRPSPAAPGTPSTPGAPEAGVPVLLDREALLESLKALGDIDQVKKELDDVIALAERAGGSAAHAEVRDRLRGVRGRLNRLSQVVAEAKEAASRILFIVEEFDVIVDRVIGDRVSWTKFAEVTERAMKLRAEGKSPEEIFHVLRKEFDGLSLDAIMKLFAERMPGAAPKNPAERR